jgi:hypothetical protein
MWQHWPGGELLRQPPPWAWVELVENSDMTASKIAHRFMIKPPAHDELGRHSAVWRILAT